MRSLVKASRNVLCFFSVLTVSSVLLGEEVVVISESAPVQVRTRQVAEVQQGDRFEVLQREGPWVAIEVLRNNRQIRGWILNSHLRSVEEDAQVAPGAPTAIAPGIEVEVKFIQFSLRGSSCVLSLQTKIKNRTNNTLH